MKVDLSRVCCQIFRVFGVMLISMPDGQGIRTVAILVWRSASIIVVFSILMKGLSLERVARALVKQ